MAGSSQENSSGSSATVFIVGVVIGGIGGGLAGWLLGGHISPLLASVLNLITGREDKQNSVRFEALQQ